MEHMEQKIKATEMNISSYPSETTNPNEQVNQSSIKMEPEMEQIKEKYKDFYSKLTRQLSEEIVKNLPSYSGKVLFCNGCKSIPEINIIEDQLTIGQINYGIKCSCTPENKTLSNEYEKNKFMPVMPKTSFNLCQVCQKDNKESLGVGICNDCMPKINLCSDCLNSHQNQQNTKYHHIKFYSENKNFVCVHHGLKSLCSFCTICKKEMCKVCLKDNKHDVHKEKFIDYINNDKVKNIFNVIEIFNKMSNEKKDSTEYIIVKLLQKIDEIINQYCAFNKKIKEIINFIPLLVETYNFFPHNNISFKNLKKISKFSKKNFVYNYNYSLETNIDKFTLALNSPIINYVDEIDKANKIQLTNYSSSLIKINPYTVQDNFQAISLLFNEPKDAPFDGKIVKDWECLICNEIKEEELSQYPCRNVNRNYIISKSDGKEINFYLNASITLVNKGKKEWKHDVKLKNSKRNTIVYFEDTVINNGCSVNSNEVVTANIRLKYKMEKNKEFNDNYIKLYASINNSSNSFEDKEAMIEAFKIVN